MNPNLALQNIRKNVLTNYAALFARLATGVFSFRLLYSHLSNEAFGYWALLWSIFGYGMLLDFGFGMTVQKKVAQLGFQEDWRELNSVLSTIFFSYCALALLILGVGHFAADAWVVAMGVQPENRKEFADLFRLFLFAMAVMFPTGIFIEVLQGLQRIALKNWLMITCTLASFCGIVWALHTDQSLFTLLSISLAGSIGPALFCAVASFRLAPQLRILPRLFSKKELGAATSFSFIAYFHVLSYVLMTKTDLLVIGSMMTVTAVAIYQPSAKVAEMFSLLTKQISAVLQPAAAHLYASGTREQIANLLVGGVRYSAMISTPIYLGTAFYLDVFLRLLTGEENLPREVFWVGQALLLWSYCFVLTQDIFKRVAIMGGHERRLLKVGLIETFANLGLSVVCVLIFNNVLGVALGTLIPALVVGWGVLWGWAAEEASLTRSAYFMQTMWKNWVANVPLLLVLICLQLLGWTVWEAGATRLVIGFTASVAVGLIFTWKVAMSIGDRARISNRPPPMVSSASSTNR